MPNLIPGRLAMAAIAIASAVYFWPVVHMGLWQGDLAAWVTANCGLSRAHVPFLLSTAIDDVWRLKGALQFVKFFQWVLLVLNACTLAWAVKRSTGSLAVAAVAAATLLSCLAVRLEQDAIAGGSLKYQIVAEALLLAFAWAHEYRASRVRTPLLLALAAGAAAVFTAGAGIVVVFALPLVLFRRTMFRRGAMATAAFVLLAFAPIFITKIATGHVDAGIAPPSARRFLADIAASLPGYYRAYGGVAREPHSTQFNYDDRFIGFPNASLSGYVVASLAALLVSAGLSQIRARRDAATLDRDLLLFAAVLVLGPAFAGCFTAVPVQHLAEVEGPETYLCVFGVAILGAGALCAFMRGRRHRALQAAMPVLAALVAYFSVIANARANALVFWNGNVDAQATSLLRRASADGLFAGISRTSVIAVPATYPFTAPVGATHFVNAVLGSAHGVIFESAIGKRTNGRVWILSEQYGPKYRESVTIAHVVGKAAHVPLVDRARIFFVRRLHGERNVRRRGVAYHIVTLPDGGEMISAHRTCAAVALRSVLDADRPAVAWGRGFIRPEGYVRLLFVRSYTLRAAKAQTWRYAGRRATLNIAWSPRCAMPRVVVAARVYTAIPAKVTLSVRGARSIVARTSQIGQYVRIEFPSNREGRAQVVLHTNAAMPETDPLAPRYASMQLADIHMLVTDVAAGFLGRVPKSHKAHAENTRQ